MAIICQLNNHIATFQYQSWGVCGPMVCSWINKVKRGISVADASDIGPIGSLILAQRVVMKASNEEGGKINLCRRNGLSSQNKFEFFAAGARFSPDRFAKAPLAHGYSYLSIRWLGEDDEPQQHVLGVWSRPDEWQLCDPNFYLWRFTDQQKFTDSLTSRLSGRGLPPDVPYGP